MKTKLIVLGTLAIALLGVIAFTTKDADAYRGDYTQVGPNHTAEREAEMEKVFETKDYDAWVALMTQDGRRPGVVDRISEENFAKFVEAKELAEQGDTEGAEKIRLELGLGQGERKGDGNGQGRGRMARDGSSTL